MSLESVLADLELFLVGLIMAGTVYCDGPQFEDPTEDFDLWSKSWGHCCTHMELGHERARLACSGDVMGVPQRGLVTR
jgi:hypothetical protein